MAQNLISLEEAAKRLNVDTEVVKKLCEDRKLYGVRDGSNLKFKPEEIERYKAEASDVTAVFSADDDFDLADDLNTDTVLGQTDPGSASDLRLADESGDLNLVDLDEPSGSGSTVHLGAEALDDDDLVLGGSDIAESGINLEKASDSGISLEEEPLMLQDDDSGSASDLEALQSDDEFNLTPMLELDDESSEASGSQVIALDSEEGFSDSGLMSDSFADPLGMPAASGGMLDEMSMQQPAFGGAPTTAMAPAPMVGGQRFGLGSVLSLSLCFVILAFTGVMVYDLVLHMWSWSDPGGSFQGVVLDSVKSMF